MKKTLRIMAAIIVLLLPGIGHASEATEARAEWARFLDVLEADIRGWVGERKAALEKEAREQAAP